MLTLCLIIACGILAIICRMSDTDTGIAGGQIIDKVQYVDPWKIGWRFDEQKRERGQSFGDPTELAPLFASKGWIASENYPKVRKATADDQVYWREYTLARIKAYEANPREEYVIDIIDDKPIKASGFEIAGIMRRAWLDKDDNVKPIDWVGTQCNRRGYCLPVSQLSYVNRHGTFFKVPIAVDPSQSDPLQRFFTRMQENNPQGKSQYRDADFIGIVETGFRLNAPKWSEAAFMRAVGLKRGTAQKFWKLGVLAMKFPNLRIQERFAMPAPTVDGKLVVPTYSVNGYLPLSRVRHDDLSSLLGETAKPSKEDFVVRFVYNGDITPYRKASESEVETYFKSIIEQSENRPKVMTSTRIEEVAKTLSEPESVAALESILKDDTSGIIGLNTTIASLKKRIAELEAENIGLKEKLDSLTVKA